MLFGEHIRTLREKRKLLLRELAAILNMDTSLLSKIELGNRNVKREQVITFAKELEVDENELLKIWIVNQVIDLVKKEDDIEGILKIANKKVKQLKENQL